MGQIVNVGQLCDQLAKDRTVVFTHGVFDLFHVGHLSHLLQSRAQGGKLVVGVDSDETAAFYKRKPIVAFNHRTRILSRLDFIDYIVTLDRNDFSSTGNTYYQRLYEAIKPTIVTYGRNFAKEQELVEDCKTLHITPVHIPEDVETVSTSDYIAQITKRFQTLH